MKMFKMIGVFVLVILVHGGPIQRISNGSSIPIEEFPFLAAVSTASGGQHCGGTILTSYYVMTAAHCVLPDLQVRVGTSARSSGGTLINVTTSTIHPSYTGGLVADLAVLGLAAPIVFDHAAVSQAPLPFQDTPVVSGVFGFIGGWGLFTPDGLPSEQLLFGEVTTTPISTCSDSYQDPTITEVLVCAASTTIDLCPGDTGGPLVTSGMVTGVALSGSCGLRDLPGLYTNVARYSTWLMNAASGIPKKASGEGKGIVTNVLVRF